MVSLDGLSDALKNSTSGLVDGEIRKRLQEKGYKPSVITALIPFGGPTLWGMDKTDDNTFGKLSEQNAYLSSGIDRKQDYINNTEI